MNFESPNQIAEILGNQLRENNYDLVDVVAIPATLDKEIRLRTLEEALAEFDGEAAPELQQYLVQVKPRRKSAPILSEEPTETEENQQIYFPDGTLNVPFLTRNAELLVGCGEYALAKNIYLKIAQAGNSASATSRALFSLAACHEAEKDFESARTRYEESIAFQPALETFEHLANLLIRQKKDRPAAEVLERAVALKDLSPKGRFDLLKTAGACWVRAGEMAAAEKAFKKALEADPTADEVQASLGSLYLKAGKFVEARRKFQDTLAANPRNDEAMTGLAMCFLQEGKKREAHDLLAQSLEINLLNAQAIYHLVKCAYELRTFATAARIVENYIQAAPVNINLLYSLAGLQFHLGRMSDATETLNQMIRLNPTHTGAKELLRRIEGLTCHGGQAQNGY